MMVNFIVERACQVISAFCQDRMYVLLPRSAEIINNISKTSGRSLSVDLWKSSLNVHRANVFSKINLKHIGVDRESSPHAKTHRRCEADLQAAADLYSNR